MKLLLSICLMLTALPVLVAAQNDKHHPALTRVQIKAAEKRLAEAGYWTGPVDGILDPATRWALIAFQKYEGRSITGRLTLDEIEAIQSTSAPTAKETGYEHVEVDLDRQVLMIVDAGDRLKILPVSTGNDQRFMSDAEESIAYTPRGRFVVYDKSFGWENGQLGSVYYANYISGGVAIHGYLTVPNTPASHGCIRIPMFAAKQVSNRLKLGTIVLVYDKQTFVSAKEWADNPKLKEAAMLNAALPDYVGRDDKRSTKRRPVKMIRTE